MAANFSRSRAVCMFAICVSLLSCASQKPPFKIGIAAAAGYRGPVHIRLCQPGAGATAQLDGSGNGVTSACPEPGDNMEIHGTRGADPVDLTREDIRVVRTGDEIPIALDADLK
jgi:hypothetical protein